MKRALRLMISTLALGTSAAALASEPTPELTEQVLDVPGFADFLAVDGDTVWATNAGRVEQWSTTGKVATVEVPRPCGAMSVAFGSLWVANCTGGEVYRIDIATAKVLAIIPTGLANPKGETNVAAGAGSIWVPSDAAGKVARIDPDTNAVIASVTVAPGTFFLAFGMDALWAVSSDGQLLQRIDPATDEVTGQVALGLQPGFLAAGEGGVWVQEQGDGTVARIDPESVAVTGRTKVGTSLLYGDIDTGAGSVWLRTTDEQTFVEIDTATLEIRRRAGAAAGSGALRYTPAGIWTSAHDVHTLSWWSPAEKATQ